MKTVLLVCLIVSAIVHLLKMGIAIYEGLQGGENAK